MHSCRLTHVSLTSEVLRPCRGAATGQGHDGKRYRATLALVLDRWSTTRPGVPTTMCGRLPSAMACKAQRNVRNALWP